jgi:hypothetical protein
MKERMNRALHILVLTALLAPAPVPAADVFTRVRDGYADSAGVRIHYVTLGRGPLVVMIHGFPDHFIQQDASTLVTRTIKRWLADAQRR